MPGKSRQQNRLSAVGIKSAGPGRHFDGNGLILFVEKNGARRWLQRFTINGKRREAGLGSPPVVTLAQAREAAIENLRAVRNGRDPIAERQSARNALAARRMTFAEAMEAFLDKKAPEFSNKKHLAQWYTTLETYALPIIGKMPVEQISVDDVLAVLTPIWLTKTETATRVRQRIEAVLRWATVAGYRHGPNPARWQDNLKERLPSPDKITKVKHQPALALTDAADWFAKLKAREGNGARALEFVALTAARSGEVRGMTWAEVDFEYGAWSVPAERMKMKREHRVPLTEAAIVLLKGLPRHRTSPFVFCAPLRSTLPERFKSRR